MNELTKDKLALLFPENREVIRANKIKDVNLINVNLSQCDFADVIFENVLFKNSTLNQSVFTRTLFKNCKLENSNFSNSIFSDALFSEDSIIKNCVFDSSYLTRTKIEATISNTSFIRASLINISLNPKKQLTGCSFTDCDLAEMNYLSQKELKKIFLKENHNIFWRARSSKTGKSLLGKKKECQGDLIEIPIEQVSLDERAGCDSGLHICKTEQIAIDFAKAHFLQNEYFVYKVRINSEWLRCVHLSGDFGRVNKYEII